MNKFLTSTRMTPAKPGSEWSYLAPGRGLRWGRGGTTRSWLKLNTRVMAKWPLSHMGPGTRDSTLVTAHQSLTGRGSGNTPLTKSLIRSQGGPILTLENLGPGPGDSDPFNLYSKPVPMNLGNLTRTKYQAREGGKGWSQPRPNDQNNSSYIR